ncbi:glycosyltransferase [Actinomadura kijaniata]|uniref:glycosyltransferase n=1 Tax=Actinomadura kijaniata TaxID=46161 RepID=UPI003F1C6452
MGSGRNRDLGRRLVGAGAGRIVTAVEHVDRTDPAYAAADVTVCRAGSATTAELAHVGVPANGRRVTDVSLPRDSMAQLPARPGMDVIAAEAGVSERTVCNHFSDKHHLFQAEEEVTAIVTSGVRAFLRVCAVSGAPDRGGPPRRPSA